MDENEITQRLRDAGRQPVPGELRASHLSQMHTAAPVVERQKRFGRLAVAAAAFVGFAVGSTGFAMAGALPGPAQGVAHDVLSVVQVQVPDRPDNRGRCVSAIANDPDLSPEQKKAAKAEQCAKGKPDHAGKGNGKGDGRPDGAGPPVERMDDGDPCTGPPPWAGTGRPSPEEKQAHKDARATCAPEEDPAQAEAEALEEQQEREAEALEERQEREAESHERDAGSLEGQQAPAVEQPQAPGGAPLGGSPEGEVDGSAEGPSPTQERPAVTAEETGEGDR